MPRASGKATKLRHDPLHAQIEGDNELKQFGRVKAGKRKAGKDDEDEPVRYIVFGRYSRAHVRSARTRE